MLSSSPMMKSFQQLFEMAVARKGLETLEERFPEVRAADELAAIPDHRYLSAMTKRVFSAGFVWRVIEAKWPGFEEAFLGFEPAAVAALGMSNPGALVEDTRIVRNAQKINATFENARWVLEVSEQHGSFGRFIADWPQDDVTGLWRELKKHGARLGGDTGPRFLRGMGKDTFILTGDVAWSLTQQGILTGKPTSKKQQQLANAAFVKWQQESGRSFAEMSVIIACTVDRPPQA